MELKPVQELTEDEFNQCYKLVREMRGMYIGSGYGWIARDKKEEMSDGDMEYLLVYGNDSTGKKKVDAFASFMRNTMEEGESVTYLYELQVSKSRQNQKLGSKLLEKVMDHQVTSSGIIMLTVFHMNSGAIRFYKRHGFEFLSGHEPDSRAGWSTMVWRR